jgi:uncharacterized protein (TIGR03086 family)
MLDLAPATGTLTVIVQGIRDDQLGDPTPCTGTSIVDLLDHVDGLSLAFTAAATKTEMPGNQGPSADASRLGPDWRQRVPQRLQDLAKAWARPDAWTGMTKAGGLDLPAELAGTIALNEVLIHAWDLAVATGQSYTAAPEHVEAATGFVAPQATQHPEGTPGLFGPVVAVPEDSGPTERLLGLTGRPGVDPHQPIGPLMTPALEERRLAESFRPGAVRRPPGHQPSHGTGRPEGPLHRRR